MSEENLVLHQSSYDAWNRRDHDAWIGLAAADAEFTPVNVEMEGGRAFRGAAGARRHWENMLAIVPDIRMEADQTRDLGDVTVANVRLVGRGGEPTRPLTSVSGTSWRGGTGSGSGGRAFAPRPRPSKPQATGA